MSFWSTQKIEEQQRKHNIVSPFETCRVQQGSYELLLSRDIATTPDGSCPVIAEDGTFRLDAGQFAFLFTEEELSIPEDTLAFISIKAKIKFKGLVNISGFHVDPGYKGKLKFSVYNASNTDIFLQCGQPAFLIWFANFEEVTKTPYNGSAQRAISLDDRQRMRGQSFAPGALNSRLADLERNFQTAVWIGGLCVIPLCLTILGCLVTKLLDGKEPNPNQQPTPKMMIVPVRTITPQVKEISESKGETLKGAELSKEKIEAVDKKEHDPISPD